MTHHTVIINEADQYHKDFIRRYYATVDISMSGSDWIWKQVDINGNYVGSTSSPFPTEDDAKDDALKKLNGNGWE